MRPWSKIRRRTFDLLSEGGAEMDRALRLDALSDAREHTGMSPRIAVGVTSEDAGVDSFAEAAARAALGLGGGPCDLALVFAGGRNLDHADAGLDAVAERLHPRALAGCGAQGVVGDGRELETGGVAVWAGSLPGAEVVPFHVEAVPAGDATALAGLPDPEEGDVALLLADPYSFPVEALLAQLAQESPGVPVIGGIASAGPGPTTLLTTAGPVAGGAVGALLRGVDVRPCVSQGARPIGPEMVVTAAEGNVIEELASAPALERVRQALAELNPTEQGLVARGLLLGIVIDPNKPEYERGDFLSRGIAAVDEASGALTVGATVRVGQTVRLQVRDADSAHDDLVHVLDRQQAELGRAPAGALLFTCNGRGSHMFGTPGHDAQAVAEAFGGAPTGGFFCAGEIGPVGPRNFVHGFTATLAVFAG
jgi:small ligand-binding sensory domain FIST